MQISVSIGEIVDKLSILSIKKDSIKDSVKLENVSKEYLYLYDIVFGELNISIEDYQVLLYINKELWDIEDAIRIKEFKKEFDEEFVSLARKVYITNDKRAEAKKLINTKYNSDFVEEKSYEQY